MTTESDFMTRDLPEHTDFKDELAVYGTHFGNLWLRDDDYEWPKLLESYRNAGEAGRRAINEVFLCLVGYTLPTLVEQAHGTAAR